GLAVSGSFLHSIVDNDGAADQLVRNAGTAPRLWAIDPTTGEAEARGLVPGNDTERIVSIATDPNDATGRNLFAISRDNASTPFDTSDDIYSLLLLDALTGELVRNLGPVRAD